MKKSYTPIKKQLMLLMATLFLAGAAFSQNTTITDDGSHTADASAVLDVHSTTLGMLVPRLGTAPTSPATGLLYYSTGTNSFNYYNGSSWAELSYGKLWSRTGTDTYLSNLTDNVVIGTNTSAPGYKFYVFGGPGTLSRFDGQVEFWNVAGGTMDADINDDGSGNGVLNVYSQASSSAKVRLESSGPSYFTGGNVGIGTKTPSTLLHLLGPGNPQLRIENNSGGGFAAQSYVGGGSNYSEGLVIADGSYILNNTGTLAAGAQSDGSTMMKAYPSGIVDFDNQSRARAYQTHNVQLDPYGNFPSFGQLIQPTTWTMVNFDQGSYDKHGEWNLAANPFTPSSYFTVTETGYYQINARVDFVLDGFFVFDGFVEGYAGPITNPEASGYVSIAIYVNKGGGFTMYAQGNKLQGGSASTIVLPSGEQVDFSITLENNLAPNVSDVLELNAGDQVAIFVWHSLTLMPIHIPLRVEEQNGAGGFPTQCYVSIHKVS